MTAERCRLALELSQLVSMRVQNKRLFEAEDCKHQMLDDRAPSEIVTWSPYWTRNAYNELSTDAREIILIALRGMARMPTHVIRTFLRGLAGDDVGKLMSETPTEKLREYAGKFTIETTIDAKKGLEMVVFNGTVGYPHLCNAWLQDPSYERERYCGIQCKYGEDCPHGKDLHITDFVGPDAVFGPPHKTKNEE